jgi:DNA-binding transcriptional regulator YhcF (GntR family)
MKSEIIKYMIVLSSFQIFLITYQTYQRSYSKLENLGIVYSMQGYTKNTSSFGKHKQSNHPFAMLW